jgi:hypothetical protein
MMSFPKLINFVFKLWLSDLSYHPFRIGRFLISSPSPLRWGKVGMAAGSEGLWLGEGWTLRVFPPTLILPL